MSVIVTCHNLHVCVLYVYTHIFFWFIIRTISVWQWKNSTSWFFMQCWRLLQNYSFEIRTLSKIINIYCKNNILYWSLFTSDKKVDNDSLVCYCRFDTVFYFHLLNIDIKMFLSIPANIVNWLGKLIFWYQEFKLISWYHISWYFLMSENKRKWRIF